MHMGTSQLFNDFRTMSRNLAAHVDIPHIAEIFLPPLFQDRQPHDSEFMALRLADDSIGISYVLLNQVGRHTEELDRTPPVLRFSQPVEVIYDI